MQHCRSLTLHRVEAIDAETFCAQAHPDFSPIGWHLGHIAYTESVWILQRLAGYGPIFPEYHRLFAQDGLPKCDRVKLPSIDAVLAYLEIVRSKVFCYLDTAPISEQERIWKWLLQHECQHAETIAIVLDLLSPIRSRSISDPVANEMIFVPAGGFVQGSDAINAQDNERPAHWVELDQYWIDRYPVTCGDYRSFIESGGYQNPDWWTDAGWDWLQARSITKPRDWLDDSSFDNHPVSGVSWYEADAYARSVQKRLPTEAEWEKAASWNPVGEKYVYPWGSAEPDRSRCNCAGLGTIAVNHHAQNVSPVGCCDMLGNVWEWTSTWFDGYSKFQSFPYPGYSQTYFDQAHRVLKGGSWATFPGAMRNAFRNWYHPHVREIFAGFRCAR